MLAAYPELELKQNWGKDFHAVHLLHCKSFQPTQAVRASKILAASCGSKNVWSRSRPQRQLMKEYADWCKESSRKTS